MSKNRNRYRSQARGQNVKLLEDALAFRARVFDKLAFRRGMARARRWLLMGLLLLPLLALVGTAVYIGLDKAYSLSIDNISYESRQKLISKEQAMKLLGIEGSINMATLDAAGMAAKLEANPCIESAHIRAELPDSLSIEIEERIPVAYVEMESAAGTGTRKRLFMDPQGFLFPVVEEFHRDFMGVPVWYLQPEDVTEFCEGAVVTEHARRPIVELVSASNLYNLTEIPAIREIFRPKEWKIIITLDGGTEVMMQVYDIRGQMERLAMVLEHARATHRRVRSANVIPRINPTVKYAEGGETPEP